MTRHRYDHDRTYRASRTVVAVCTCGTVAQAIRDQDLPPCEIELAAATATQRRAERRTSRNERTESAAIP